jgi:hypothetical protein
MTWPQIGLAAGGSIFAILGALHGVYTLMDVKRPRRIVPDDPALIQAMASTGVRLARGGTTMWRAWIGFNLSHSLGAVMFGVACIVAGALLAALSPPRAALFIPVAIGCLYELLAVRYWFRIPVIGIGVATLYFVAAWLAY